MELYRQLSLSLPNLQILMVSNSILGTRQNAVGLQVSTLERFEGWSNLIDDMLSDSLVFFYKGEHRHSRSKNTAIFESWTEEQTAFTKHDAPRRPLCSVSINNTCIVEQEGEL